MKHNIILVTLILTTFFGFSQKKDIELITNQNDKGFVISAVNNTSIQQEVTLTVTVINLTGYKAPIKKLVPAKTTLEMLRLNSIKNKQGSFKFSYSNNPSMTKSETIAYNKKVEEKTTTDVGDIDKGIIVFSKDGCPRCHYTTRFMLDNNIVFRLVNISKDEKQHNLMWKILKQDKPFIENLIMPVILIDGKISYSIDDLKGFVSELKN